jgi:hypothetical protein
LPEADIRKPKSPPKADQPEPERFGAPPLAPRSSSREPKQNEHLRKMRR